MKRVIIAILILAGLAGTVIFFPVSLESGHNCLFHRWTGAVSVHAGHHQLMHYLGGFAFAWWGSLAGMSAGIWLWVRNRNLTAGQGK